MMESIAVFIPVYNGEKHIRQTIESVLLQTYYNYKIYCVDDSSTDQSLNILKDLESKDRRVKIFTKENGGGTAKSWNFILPWIIEDFIFYMSQDDLLSSDIFEKMIERYKITKADCVVPNMMFFYENQRNENGIFGDDKEIINGKEAFHRSLFWEIHGFALRKKELYYNEFFFEDTFDTDEYMTRKLFYKSKKVAFSKGTFFYRQDNPNAITKSFTTKNYYSLLTYLRVYELLKRDKKSGKHRLLWFNFMLDQFQNLSHYFKKDKGISSITEKQQISQLLKKTKAKFLYEALFIGKFWAKRNALKKIFNKRSQ